MVRWVRVAVAGAVMMAGLAGCGQGQPKVDEPDPVERCLEFWASSHSPAPDRNARVFTKDDGKWARVYLERQWAGVCTEDGSFSTVVENRSGSGTVEFFGGYETVFKTQVMFGRVPEGTQRVEATLASGKTAQAQTDGEVFVVWRGEETFEYASVKAFGAQGLLGIAEAPSELDWEFAEQAFAVNCEKRLKDVVRQGVALPPLRMQVRAKSAVVWVYTSDQVTVACHWTPSSRGTAAREPGLGAAVQAGSFGAELSALGEDRGWMVGWAPAGTRRVEVVLGEGNVIPATLDGQLFVAAWESPGAAQLKLFAYTDTGIFTKEEGQTVFQPR